MTFTFHVHEFFNDFPSFYRLHVCYTLYAQMQSPQQDVWGEWRALEGDLQSLAQV